MAILGRPKLDRTWQQEIHKLGHGASVGGLQRSFLLCLFPFRRSEGSTCSFSLRCRAPPSFSASTHQQCRLRQLAHFFSSMHRRQEHYTVDECCSHGFLSVDTPPPQRTRKNSLGEKSVPWQLSHAPLGTLLCTHIRSTHTEHTLTKASGRRTG